MGLVKESNELVLKAVPKKARSSRSGAKVWAGLK